MSQIGEKKDALNSEDEQFNVIPSYLRAKKIKASQQKNFILKGQFNKKFDYHTYSLNTTVTPVYDKNNDITYFKQDTHQNVNFDFDLLKINAQYQNSHDNSLKFTYKVKNIFKGYYFQVNEFQFPLTYKSNFSQWELRPKIVLSQDPFVLEVQGNSLSRFVENSVINEQYFNSDLKFVEKINENAYLMAQLSYKQMKPSISANFYSRVFKRQLINFENHFNYNTKTTSMSLRETIFRYQKNNYFYTQLTYKPQDSSVQFGLVSKFSRDYRFQGVVTKKNDKLKYELGLDIKKFKFANVEVYLNESQKLSAQVQFKNKQLRFNTLFQTNLLSPWERKNKNFPLQFQVSFNDAEGPSSLPQKVQKQENQLQI